jgi:hypothetical protein
MKSMIASHTTSRSVGASAPVRERNDFHRALASALPEKASVRPGGVLAGNGVPRCSNVALIAAASSAPSYA